MIQTIAVALLATFVLWQFARFVRWLVPDEQGHYTPGVHSLDTASVEPKPAPPRENATICNTSYIDRSVMLGDTDFKYCQFIRCQLINDGPFSMEDCFMESCSLQSANVVKAQVQNDSRGERRHNISTLPKRVPLTKTSDQV